MRIENLQRTIDGRTQPVSPSRQRADCFCANASRRHVEHPRQADAVVGVMHYSQVGQHVLDLAPGVKTRGPHQLVGHTGVDKGVFQRAGLGVGAIHHRAIAGAGQAVALELADCVHHVPRFVRLVVRFVGTDAGPRAFVGMQPLGRAVKVAGNDGVGHIEDGLRRAVVLLQQDHVGIGEILAKAGHVAIVRATEAIDRLILVAHDKDVAVCCAQQ